MLPLTYFSIEQSWHRGDGDARFDEQAGLQTIAPQPMERIASLFPTASGWPAGGKRGGGCGLHMSVHFVIAQLQKGGAVRERQMQNSST